MKILRGDLEIYEIKDYKQAGRFMEVAYIECTIESPTPIDFQIGDKVIFDYNNLPYTIYDTPSIKKQARARSYGKAFVYELKFKADTEQLDICPFLDIVPNDNNVHYTSLPSFSTFEDVYGIAARIQANMDYLYPNQWIIRVASTTDAELSETLSEAKEFSVSSESCLDALKKIYDTWGVSFIHTVENGKNVITIGKSAGTTGLFQYGLNQGLRTIKKSIQNPDQLCTRLYAFGSTRNVPARWYNQNGYIGESQYAPHLMLPPSLWKGNSPKGAYIDAIFGNGDNRIEKYGLRIKTFVYDGTNGREEIYPSVHGITAKNIREAKAELGETKYVPSTSRYPNASRMDSVLTGSNISDNGTAVDDGYELYSQKTEVHVSLVSGQVNMAPQNGVLTVVHDIDICTFDITKAAVYRLSEIDGAVFLLKNDIYSNVTAQLYIRKPDGNLIKLPEEKIFKDTINALVGIPEYGFQANISGSYKLFVRVSIDWTDVSFADTILPEEGFSLKWDVLENNISIARGENILNPQFNISIKQIGFNLNDVTASDNSKKTIHFLTGMCSGRTFEIDQCEYSESNDSWNLTCRRVDDSEVSQRFPNKTFRVKAGDQFVLLNINMPDLYVYTAMQRLYDAALKDLKYYSTPQYVIEPEIDNIKMLRSPQVVKEGMYMPIQDSDISLQDDILIDSVTITNKGNESRKFEVALRNDKIYNRFNKIATQLADLESSNKVSAQESARTPASDNTIEIVPDYVRRIEQLENLFGVDANGDVYVKTKDAETPRNFYTLGEISSGGVGEPTEGGNGIATILDAAKLGTIATEDLSQTFSAYAVDSIYKQVQAIIQGGVGGGGGLTKELADTYYAPLDYFNNGIAKKATLLEKAPVLKKYSDTSITVTAGGQESSAFVVPYAAKAGAIDLDGDLDLGGGSLKVGGTAVIEKDTTIKGILHLKSALMGAEGMTLDWYGSIWGYNISPQKDSTYDLGSSDYRWKNAYINNLKIGDAVIYWDNENQCLRTNKSFASDEGISSGGLDTTSLWAELAKDDTSKVIHSSHIPDLKSKYVTLGDTQTITGAKTFNGDIVIKNATITGSLTGSDGVMLDWYGNVWADNISPQKNATYDLGSETLKWKNAYISSSIFIGGAKIWWDSTNDCLRVDKSFSSDGEVSSGGIGDDSDSGSSVNLLLSWTGTYDNSYALSAKLGKELKNSLDELTEVVSGLGGQTPSVDAYTKTESDNKYALKSWFNTNGYANQAVRLSGTDSYTIWGQTYWLNGVPKTVTGPLNLDGNQLNNAAHILPKSNSSYALGSTSLKWHTIYVGNIEGLTSLKANNAQFYSYLRLKPESANYGSYLYFGDSNYSYIAETADDVLTIYSKNGIELKSATTFEQNILVKNATIRPVTTKTGTLGTSSYIWNEAHINTQTIYDAIYIGGTSGAKLWWDNSEQCLRVDKSFASDGEVSAGGVGEDVDLYQTSDITLKNVIEDVSLSSEVIANTPMFKFTWKDREDERVFIGTSAQYWVEHAKELTVLVDDKYALDYATLGVLMGKSNATEIEILKAEVKELRTKVENYEKMLNAN